MLKKIVTTAFMMISMSAFAANGHDEVVEKLFPNIAKNTLEVFSKQVPIKVQINNGLDDGAQAAREYVDYSQTKSCTISVNPDHYIFQDEVNPFTQIGLTIPTIKNILMLHELAHCLDGEPAPEGIDPEAWREALGDGFAVSMVYNKYQISSPKITRLSLFRNTNKNGGAHTMLNYMSGIMEREEEKNVDPMVVLNKAKELRRKAFNVKTEPSSGSELEKLNNTASKDAPARTDLAKNM